MIRSGYLACKKVVPSDHSTRLLQSVGGFGMRPSASADPLDSLGAERRKKSLMQGL